MNCYCFCSTFSCRLRNGVRGFCQRCPRLLGCGRWVWPFFEKWDLRWWLSLALVLLCSFCPTLLVALMSCICFGRSFRNNKSVKPTCSAQICWYWLFRSGRIMSRRLWMGSQFAWPNKAMTSSKVRATFSSDNFKVEISCFIHWSVSLISGIVAFWNTFGVFGTSGLDSSCLIEF